MAYHCLTKYKDAGNCRTLRGDVLFYLFFVNEPGKRQWTDRAKQKVLDYCDDTATWMGMMAPKDLKMHWSWQDVSTDGPLTAKNRYEYGDRFAREIGCKSLMDLHNTILARNRNLRHVAFIFVLRRRGTSYAGPSRDKSRNPGRPETLALYWDLRHSALMHEILHLFGAVDFYIPYKVEAAAKRYFPDSVMLDGANLGIDPLTQYLVGWRDDLTPEAQAMLDATRDVTEEEVDQAREDLYKKMHITLS